ncbi:aminodeoxychorismate lyase [Chloroherpeton thalassium ATCC 35110]|uniref:Endolytic murein transglycosylase n=1 Tax=Chloroherpeton thalassium (strain ATCC 35110 / GB-78) TaxID=517418 RepID=B3QWS5_CHLT3|nr:endolytic transglycosylase MltG [Chloroherpeton thalassium]ACF13289.1 aminodeoxychorismate lyase [Chloroherpeton thalassium ATCC 35110]
MKRLLQALGKLILMGVIAVMLAGALGFFYLFKSSYNAVSYDKPKRMIIRRGTPYVHIIQQLQEKGVIKEVLPMRLVGYLMPEKQNIKPGRYDIPSGLSSAELIDFLYRHEQDEVRLRVPEGSRGEMVAKIVSDSLEFAAQDFMTAFSDTTLLQSLQVHAPSFEGYLLPDTYNMPWEFTAEDVIRFLVGKLNKFYRGELSQLATQAGLSKHEVLTLASIVEAETPIVNERPVVASVYLNRLKRGMRLQADPTVQFALGGKPRRLLYRDLEVDSPYNTYLHAGLPPGPIGNPSRSAIEAVIKPAKTNYLYFVATGNGGHNFSRTAAEHHRNVEKYRVIMRQKRAAERLAKRLAKQNQATK